MQKVIKAIKDCVASKTCCEETGADCNQGRKCPVRDGTHKPAEAVHQIQEPTVNQQLTDAQIKEGRRAVNDNPDDQPEPWAFREGVKFAERMHGITKENQV